MTRFLSLFPQFRALRKRFKAALRRISTLERENQALESVNADLKARNDADQQQIAELIERVDAARQSEIEATRQTVDFFARKTGRPVFGYASEVPERDFESQKPIERYRQQASVMVQDAERLFIEELQHYKHPKQSPESVAV